MSHLIVFACSILFCQPAANDWPSWRGSDQNGCTPEKAPVTEWSPDGKNVLWKSPEGGRSTPVVMNGRVFFIGPVGDDTCLQERVICLDAHTGKTLWEYRFNVFFTDIVAQRVGWTSVVGDSETGNIYAHTTGGDLIALNRDGKLLWQRGMTQEFNRVSGYGGRIMNPVVDEDRVIISFLNSNWGNHAKPCHRYGAFDKRTGHVVWWSEPGGVPVDTTYAIPFVTVIDGRRILVAPGADGKVYGIDSRTGQPIWSYTLSKLGLNVSPVGDGKYVYLGHSEENVDTTDMGRFVCIDASKTGDITKTGEIWRMSGVDAGYTSPALANARVYVVDNSANLFCVDAKKGKTIWKQKLGRVGKGSPTVTADGVIYVGEQNGMFFVLKDAGEKCEVLCKTEFKGVNDTIDEIYGSPAVCGGRVYFMTRYGFYCLGTPDSAKGAGSAQPGSQEPEWSADEAAVVQIVPADVNAKPGDSVSLHARGFDKKGREVREFALDSPKAEFGVQDLKGNFIVKAPVVVDGKTLRLDVAKEARYDAGIIKLTAGAFHAIARVRISPPLPINENFDRMKVDVPPPGWVGATGKTKIDERDGSKCLRKLAEKGKPSPVWKMRTYSNPPIAGGYTVTADLLGTKSRRFKPDMGLINSGYEFILMGMTRELELSRWRDEPTHGLRKKISMELTPDQWYRMKLRVAMEGGKARVQGKIWPRSEKEPDAWTIEFDDPCGNREGSPGIFVYSNGTTDKSDGAEVFIDNYQVNTHE